MQEKIPDFIGIGAARAGSTWLFNQLDRDNRIWMPRIKELHYFSRAAEQCGPSYLSRDKFLSRLVGGEQHNRDFRKKFFRATGSNILRPSLEKFRWDSQYWFGDVKDDWYLSLFQQAGDRFCGEITPAYSALDDAGVKHVASLLPDTKIIHFLREPVDRAWSLVRYHQKKEGESYTGLETEALLKRARHRFIVEQSNYEQVMQRWSNYFSNDQLMVRFYDEITQAPENLLEEVYRFFELEPDPEVLKGDLGKRVNPSFAMNIPESFSSALARDYLPMVERLSGERGGYFASWLENYRALLS